MSFVSLQSVNIFRESSYAVLLAVYPISYFLFVIADVIAKKNYFLVNKLI